MPLLDQEAVTGRRSPQTYVSNLLTSLATEANYKSKWIKIRVKDGGPEHLTIKIGKLELFRKYSQTVIQIE